MVPEASKPDIMPPLKPALIAMMALQAIVAMALFAPGILAPKLGLSETGVTLFATNCFAVGMVSASVGGSIVGRLGSMAVAGACMVAVMLCMGLATTGTLIGLLAAGLVLGLAFGPETPASSALLGRLANARQRPVVFSIRQTGNQIGAISASLILPVLAVIDPRLGYAMIAGVAGTALLVFLTMRERYDPITRTPGQKLNLTASLGLIHQNMAIRSLTLVSVPLSAMQLTLNAFLVLFLTGALSMAHVNAGMMLAVGQAGGLIGRLGWGYVATLMGKATTVISVLAIAMAIFAVVLSQFTPETPILLVAVTVFGLGLTASGWNGVFLAEVARQAPEGRVADATGAVLTASYLGLVTGPMIVSALSLYQGLWLAFAVMGSCCACAGVLFFWMTCKRQEP